MKKFYKNILLVTIVIFGTSTFIFVSCKKENAAANRVVQETYMNRSGYDITITRFFKNFPAKNFDIANNDTLIIENPDNATADSAGTIRFADSAKVVFSDGKTYMMIDTTKTTANFLNEKNFISTISPSGKIHYLRFTLTSAIYDLAKNN
jgi:hypothetical protein